MKPKQTPNARWPNRGFRSGLVWDWLLALPKVNFEIAGGWGLGSTVTGVHRDRLFM